MSDEEDAVEMFVGGLVLDPNSQAPVVVLKDESGKLNLPIWIGIAEATSIASVLKDLNMARPLTHDLLSTILTESGVSLERVLITALKDSTYYAELILSQGDKVHIIDSRPSDAIALALRAEAPIFVARDVLEQAQIAIDESPGEAQGEEHVDDVESEATEDEASNGKDFRNIDKDRWNELLGKLNADDFKYKM